MPIPEIINLPSWAFEAALYISQERFSHFRNRFRNRRLRLAHNNLPFEEHVESIVGYLGDIAASIFLGMNPEEMLINMIIATDCLTHRDEYDLIFRGNNIDVKIEDYNGYHQKVINNEIRYDEPYGCRLINQSQWEENGELIDYYLFGTFDQAITRNHTLDRVEYIYLIGYMSKTQAEQYEFSEYSPAHRRLWTPAKIIPNDHLIQVYLLRDIPYGTREINVVNNITNRCNELIGHLSGIIGG